MIGIMSNLFCYHFSHVLGLLSFVMLMVCLVSNAQKPSFEEGFVLGFEGCLLILCDWKFVQSIFLWFLMCIEEEFYDM